jgi:hypothetical protein
MKRYTLLIVLVVIVMILVVIPTFNYYVLQRPIKAGPDDVVLQPDQMPVGWSLNATDSYLYYKGEVGCEYHVVWQSQNSYYDPGLSAANELTMRIYSYELVVWSETRFDEMMDDWGEDMEHMDGIGQEGEVGFLYAWKYLPNSTHLNSTDMYVSSVTTTYIFREGNVLAFIQFQTDFDIGDEAFEPRYDWMDQIVKEQAQSIHEENVFPWL